MIGVVELYLTGASQQWTSDHKEELKPAIKGREGQRAAEAGRSAMMQYVHNYTHHHKHCVLFLVFRCVYLRCASIQAFLCCVLYVSLSVCMFSFNQIIPNPEDKLAFFEKKFSKSDL